MTQLSTIRARLTLWYTGFLALTLSGFSIYLHLELQDNLAVQLDEGLRLAASHLLVDVDDSVSPPALRPMSEQAETYLLQSSFALRLVDAAGTVAAEVGDFPLLDFRPPAEVPGAVEGFQTALIDGVPWRIYTQPMQTAQTAPAGIWLQMGQSLTLVRELQQDVLRLIAFGLPVMLLIAALGGIFLADRALRPVDSITRTARSITATDLSRRIEAAGPADELGRLATTLNSMLDRIEAAFEAERRFTADASHELRTPLSIIKGQVSVTLTRARAPEDYQRALAQIQAETDRLIRLTNDLLYLARLDAAGLGWQPERINLSDLLEAVIEQARALADDKALTLRADIAPDVCLDGTPDHLIRLFLNLIDNAIKYTPPGGEIALMLHAPNDAKAECAVTVRDSGIGISPQHLPHLFERFYRVEAARGPGGAGLGLAIADQIARAHHGAITVESAPGAGTTVSVTLPADVGASNGA